MISELLDLQAGVISRRQAMEHGLKPHDIQRLLRRREWARVHRGVFVDHTGELTWLQRAWAATVWAAPSALCLDSALRAANGAGKRDTDDTDRIHVAVPRERSGLTPPDGVVLHCLAHLEGRVHWNLSPPRMRYEEAALDVACAASDRMAAVAALANACQSRRTTAGRLIESLDARARVPDRPWITSVLRDVADGTNSVLEHGYLTLVERPHGLPGGLRQVRERISNRGVERDVVYEFDDWQQVNVELDGRLFHDTARQRDLDLDRDLEAAVVGSPSVRLGWGQVFDRPCVTAQRMGVVLQRHGWDGRPIPCSAACAVRTAA